MAGWGFHTPREKVIRTDILAMAFNQAKLSDRMLGAYDLACGHKQVGRLGARSLHCDSCQRIVDLGLDYDGFRNHGLPDPLLDLPEPEAQGSQGVLVSGLELGVGDE